MIATIAMMGLAGCTPMEKIGIDWPQKKTDQSEPVVQDDPGIDTPAVDEDVDLPKPAEGVGFLGVTVASLGDPAKEGFWIETPLVTSSAKGHVSYAKSGRTVKVDLIPIDGPATAGSRLSLSAMRLLDAPLAGLPEVKVYRD
ncbi:hypothetical protein [Thalassovita sp.]|uniref:hypothetical protein n=1 Tax=Thalassovita sp. TaxID=1979401 RepID=UPI002882A41A|nr:hypothetical protein [Thalassovita sp.]MDF1802796.1 hypothetical protein [Thalassovita sp.]